MTFAEDTMPESYTQQTHTGRTFRIFTLALLTLVLPWLAVACSNDTPVSIAPADNHPTFIWIFSDP